MVRSILWFRQDLRLHDNEALLEAARISDELIPVYIFDVCQFRPITQYKSPKTGYARTRFLIESVADLRRNLQSIGSDLIVRSGNPVSILTSLASGFQASYIYCNRERTREEVRVQDKLEKQLWSIGREVRYSRGKMLYYTSDLPFPITHCPDAFASFRKEVEQLVSVRQPLDTPTLLPTVPEDIDKGIIPDIMDLIPWETENLEPYFHGGETAALSSLKNGVETNLPLFPPYEATMLSPWIAMGCLSPKTVYHESAISGPEYEDRQQHLLYRDYLRLMGKKYGDRIFYKSGIKGIPLKNKKDFQLLENWKAGRTGTAIVDAAMHQLNRSGWLPDSLRKLVSGYFIKVLNLDWRLGAAYFEARLIDYDPCTNWISWLNMAGLGPDTREDRIINYEAVGKRLDPEGTYISTWN